MPAGSPPRSTTPRSRPRRVSGGGSHLVGLTASATAELDNVSVGPLAEPVRRAAPVPQPGRVLAGYSDDFAGVGAGPGLDLRAAGPGGDRARWRAEVAGAERRPHRRLEQRGRAAARRPGRQLDRRDEADAGPGRGHGAQLPAGRADRVRRGRPVRAAVRGGDLEHPPGRVRPRDPVRRHHLVRRHHRGHARPDDHLAAAGAPRRPGRRRARVPRRGQPRRPHLDLGRRVDAARRHGPRGSAWSPTAAPQPAVTASFDYLRFRRW